VRLVAGSLVALIVAVAAVPARAAPVTSPAVNWSGFYLGAHGGYAWSGNHNTAFGNFWQGQFPDAAFNADAGFGGFQLGYNWQVGSRWVFGVETDLSFGDIEGSASSSNPFGGFNATVNVTETVKWFGTVRARLGWLVTDHLMLYGTGGIAYGRVEQNASTVLGGPAVQGFADGSGAFSFNCLTPAAPCFAGSSSEVRAGWTLGGGGEWALWNNWSLKAEYLYVNLGSNSFPMTATATLPGFDTPATVGVRPGDVDFHIVRGGLNWRFAAGMPPPAHNQPGMADRWTGFYIGAHGGYGWGGRDVAFLDNQIGVFPDATFNVDGGIGGFQLGYNWRLDPRWVGGFEADLSFGEIKGHGSATSTFFGSPDTIAVSEKIKWFGTVRARLGWLVTDQLLVYGTGGVAYGSVERDASHVTSHIVGFGLNGVSFVCTPGIPCFTGVSSERLIGWTAGGGAEWALGNNWSVKAEYLYVNLGEQAFPMTATATAGAPFLTPATVTVNSGDIDFHTVRAGLNLRF
jgi:outer membrane immunogenic protein